MKTNSIFTDRDFELFGTYPGDYPEGGHGKTWSIKARIFFLLVIMALVCGGMVGLGAW